MGEAVITVVGSYIVGMTMRVKRFPTPGETLIGSSFCRLHGGKGSNQAIGCARLGAQVSFITSIGDDQYGKEALELFQREGISPQSVQISGKNPTAVGFVTVNEKGHNIITLDLGANLDLTADSIERYREVIAGSDVLLMQLEIPTASVHAAAAIAKEYGVKVILNPAPYQHLSDAVWANITIATPNEKEARLILGYGPEEEVGLEVLGQGLMEKGVESVVITLGDRGVYFSDCKQPGKSTVIPARKVDVVDTTGAGDCFNAALGTAIAEGRSLTDAVFFATAAASLSVQKYGVIESLPFRKEVGKVLSHGK